MSSGEYSVQTYGFAIIMMVVAHSSATTIVLIRTPEHIVVGADSLVVNWQATPATRNLYLCKLHKQGSTFFTVAGMGVVHQGTRFSAEQLVRVAIEHSTTMDEASAYFARIAVEPYSRVMRIMRQHNPDQWKFVDQYKGQGIALVVAFFGVEDRVPKYVIVGFRVSTGKRITVMADTASCPGLACKTERYRKHGTIIGQSQAAYRRIGGTDQSSFMRFQAGRSDVEIVQSIIAIEEHSVPAAVGGAIEIVSVDAAGEHWNCITGPCIEPK
jgi:hypothetical protein